MKQISAVELADWLHKQAASDVPCLLDVREAWETDVVVLPDSLCIPMGHVPARLDEVPTGKPIVCICHHGVRSMQVAHFLGQRGFKTVYNLQGGIDSWAREVDLNCATY